MHRSTQLLKGPQDKAIDEIIEYMRLDRARADSGKKAKRSEVSEDISPRLREAVLKRVANKPKPFRRY